MRRAPWYRKVKTEQSLAKDFVSVTITLPNEQYKFLAAESERKILPLSRLLSYAVDNERDQPVPFNYPCETPRTTFVPFAYSNEGQKILAFLQRFPSGLSRDNLMLFRRAFGIPNKITVLLALRELLEAKVITETPRKPHGQQFDFAPDHKWLRISTHLSEKLDKKRSELNKKKAAIALEEERLQIKEYLNATRSVGTKTSDGEET